MRRINALTFCPFSFQNKFDLPSYMTHFKVISKSLFFSRIVLIRFVFFTILDFKVHYTNFIRIFSEHVFKKRVFFFKNELIYNSFFNSEMDTEFKNKKIERHQYQKRKNIPVRLLLKARAWGVNDIMVIWVKSSNHRGPMLVGSTQDRCCPSDKIQ